VYPQIKTMAADQRLYKWTDHVHRSPAIYLLIDRRPYRHGCSGD